MAQLQDVDAERLADGFVQYLFDEYKGTRHVRRVASRVGFVVKGIERVATEWHVPRTRQLVFTVGGRKYKARYEHGAGPRGGVEILEVLPGRGAPDGTILVTISSLD